MSVDRVLNVLDAGIQRTNEVSYGDYDRSACWKCSGPPGAGPSGVCDHCRRDLLADVEPAWPGLDHLCASFAAAWDQLSRELLEQAWLAAPRRPR